MTTQFILQSAVDFPVAMWMDKPTSSYQGCTAGTFKLYLYTEDIGPHWVSLYSAGSYSMPWQEPQNKWSHLNPEWQFTDLSGNNINGLTLADKTITTFNGTTGYMASAEFYYKDDLPGTVVLWAVAAFSHYPVQKDNTLNSQSVSGYANSQIVAAEAYNIQSLTPSALRVSRDGINNMTNFYWVSTPIPYVVSVVGIAGPYSATMKNIPPTNEIGAAYGSIVRSATNISDQNLIWSPSNGSAYLSALDDKNFPIAGYLKGDVTSKEVMSSVQIVAHGNISYGDLSSPYLWISNPENNSFNRIFAPHINDSLVSISASFVYGMTETVFDTSFLQVTAATTDMALTGFHGIYGVAVDGNKNVWCTDIESDKVYMFNTNGVLLSTFNFGDNNTYTFGVTGGCMPAGIAIDGVSGVWITLFGAASVVCLDQYTGCIKQIINFDLGSTPYADPLIMPILTEPDIDNNIWITFNSTLCGSLMKYSPSAQNILTTINFPTCANPMGIVTTMAGDVWVGLANHAGPPYGMSMVNKYQGDSPYALLSSIPARNPSYFAMDAQESLWFAQSGNTVTRVTSAGIITDWTVGSPVPSGYISTPEGIFFESAIEGICCDRFNRIYIINSIDNSLYTIINDRVYLGCRITPVNRLAWYNDRGYIYTESNTNNKSAQAFGDWSGNRWARKYSTEVITNVGLSGVSSPFDVYDFNGYNIRRYNESWDAVNQIRSFARTPQIADNTVLWDQYMTAVWGDAASPQGASFGREAYEKIANFVPNTADINTCNINQLYSLAQCTDVSMDNFGFTMPPELRRIMDICSVNQQQLWGARCKCHQNITNSFVTYTSAQQRVITDYLCEYCGHMHPGNRGSAFNATNYVVTAFTPFVTEDKISNEYQLIIPPLSGGSISVYPLSSYYHIVLPPGYGYGTLPTVYGFHEAIAYFNFYSYVDLLCEQQIAGVINWDDPYTTLNENASSLTEWYGSGQTLERIINYTLYKGLGLIGD